MYNPSGIYQITIDGVPVYVGSTFNLPQRQVQHWELMKTSDKPLYTAMREAGLSRCVFETVEEATFTQLRFWLHPNPFLPKENALIAKLRKEGVALFNKTNYTVK